MTDVSWEHWFQEYPAASVRTQLKNYERNLEEESKANQNAVGSKYPELIALAHRLDSLKALGTDLEGHLSEFSTEVDAPILPKSTDSPTDVGLKALIKLKKLLTSLGDRSLIQHRYATCAHAIYLNNALKSKDNMEMSKVASKLSLQLKAWLSQQTHLPQSLYAAYSIHFQVSPEEFVQQFLELRKSRVNQLLATSVTEAFKCVDSTAFIFEQIISDLSQSRITQRRLVDLPDFNEPTMRQFIKITCQYYPDVLNYRAYPEKSYQSLSAPELSRSRLETFIQNVAEIISSSDLFSASSSHQLVLTLSSIISQAQSALSAETSMALLLESLIPGFSSSSKTQIKRHLSQINAVAIEELKNEFDQLLKLSHHMEHFAPEAAKLLSETVSVSSDSVSGQVRQFYEERFAESSGQSPMELPQMTTQLNRSHELNNTYAQSGGTPNKVPRGLYAATADKLVAKWKNKRHYWGERVITGMWDLQSLLDESGISNWDDGLNYIRDILLSALVHQINQNPELKKENSGQISQQDTRQGEQQTCGQQTEQQTEQDEQQNGQQDKEVNACRSELRQDQESHTDKPSAKEVKPDLVEHLEDKHNAETSKPIVLTSRCSLLLYPLYKQA